jgi:hypothetical protein
MALPTREFEEAVAKIESIGLEAPASMNWTANFKIG